MQEYIDFFSNNQMLSIAWLAIAVMLVHSIVKDKLSAVKSVAAQQATLMINNENALVVDVRSSEEYKKGHIVNAKNITLSQIEQGKFTGIVNNKHTPIIVVCESGVRSANAASKLHKAGFTQVYNLSAGMDGWVSANLPATKK